MKTTVPLLDNQQTVSILVRILGTPVAWAAWLADIRRTPRPDMAPPQLHGHQLHPYASKGIQPLYRAGDVRRFIRDVQAADSGMKPTKPALYAIDDQPELPWQWRRATRPSEPSKRTA